MSRYHPVTDGEWIQPKRRGHKMACCDCGLVHVLNFRQRDGRIQFQAFRDKEKTRKRRKREGITVRRAAK